MSDGLGGFLVDGIEPCAESILKLPSNEGLSRDLGEKGRDRVREHFLLPNELSLVRDLMEGCIRLRAEMDGHRDPVCGMTISDPIRPVSSTFARLDFSFCSEGCKARFLATPERYVAARQRA